MKFLFLIFLTAVITTLSTCYNVSHFKICASDHLSRNKDYACQISRFNTEVNEPASADDFFDCCFITSGWMDRGSKKLLLENLMRDMSANNDNKQRNIKEVVSSCESELKKNINARQYFRCLLMCRETKKAFKAMLKKQESKFFNDNYCRSRL